MRRQPGPLPLESETAEVVDALWAHAVPGDGLQHTSASAEPDRIDLLIYLMTRDDPGASDTLCRAHILLTRSQHNAPRLRMRYLPPVPHTQDVDHVCR
ncbi:hypothetical protein AB0O22_39405 [Streptomyces sp. NPDC091204]|uniref:hypothetical protein n=1 Tax=Streptomyces sp. NPDC091204 TaxID=3155299 RepID=UPI003414E7BE